MEVVILIIRILLVIKSDIKTYLIYLNYVYVALSEEANDVSEELYKTEFTSSMTSYNVFFTIFK